MRKTLWRGVLALAAAAVLSGAPVTARTSDGAAPVTGLWLSSKEKVLVDIYPCEDRFCGRIVWLAKQHRRDGGIKRDDRNPDPAKHDRAVCGIEVLTGLKPKGGDAWRKGTLYYPKKGETYDVDIEMKSRDAIEIRAYVGIPLLGKSEVWTRPEPGQEIGCASEPKAG